MTPDQLKCIQLRDCFYGGYSMPQYCRDRGIKKPLIASYDPEFLWELYVQFRYDKEILPAFRMLAGEGTAVSHGMECVVGGCRFEKLDLNKVEGYDKIILLTTNRFPQLPVDRTVYFDTLLRQCAQYVYAERPLYHYLDTHRGVRVVLTGYPVLKRNELSTEREKVIVQKNVHVLRKELKERNGKVLKTRFDEFGYSNDQVYSILALSDARTNLDGTSDLVDSTDPLIRTENGKRLTAYQNGEYSHTIWCMGTCVYYGIGSPYDKTIESYLQQILNENGHEWRVENASQFYSGRYQDIFYNLNRLPVKEGDIVLICLQNLRAEKLPYFDCRNLFDRPHNYGEVFADSAHINERGNQIYARKFYEYLVENDFFRQYEYSGIPEEFPSVHQYGIVKIAGGGYRFKISLSWKSIKRSCENSVRLWEAS